jgi:SAM-dependent methyltransferase
VERNSGLRALLTRPAIYEAFQRAVGARHYREVLAGQYLRVAPGARVLDIGCGPGDMVEWLPDAKYVGFDPSDAYISAAKERYGERADFHVGDVREADPEMLGSFDVVIAIGVLHHIDDVAAAQLIALAAAVLRPGGRLVTVDPCFSPEQSALSRKVVSMDRGGNVRSADAYRSLAARSFDTVRLTERHDLLRIPYTHLIVECEVVPVPAEGTAR